MKNCDLSSITQIGYRSINHEMYEKICLINGFENSEIPIFFQLLGSGSFCGVLELFTQRCLNIEPHYGEFIEKANLVNVCCIADSYGAKSILMSEGQKAPLFSYVDWKMETVESFPTLSEALNEHSRGDLESMFETPFFLHDSVRSTARKIQSGLAALQILLKCISREDSVWKYRAYDQDHTVIALADRMVLIDSWMDMTELNLDIYFEDMRRESVKLFYERFCIELTAHGLSEPEKRL